MFDTRFCWFCCLFSNIIHHVGIKRDISQQVEAHDSLRQVAKRIAEVQEELQSQSEPSLYPGRNGEYRLTF